MYRRVRLWLFMTLVLSVASPTLYNAAGRWSTSSLETRKAHALKNAGADITHFYCGPDWMPFAIRPYIPVFDRIAMVNFRGSSQVDDSAMESLTRLEHLLYLDLHGTGISDSGLQSLGNLHGLRILKLSQTNVTDSGLEHLKELVDLEILDIESTNVSERGRQWLRKNLPGCGVSPDYSL